MMDKKRILGAQLRMGDNELTSFGVADVLAKIGAARDLAGLDRLFFIPTRDKSINDSVLNHCRRLGVEVFLWYKVLSDNSIAPEKGELAMDAFGKEGAGETGVWGPIFHFDEDYRFACPRNEKYNQLLLTRCREQLREYDGLFVDCVVLPPPSLGIEAMFTCYCPTCVEAEPRMEDWRQRVVAMRDHMETCTDEDLERWGDFHGHAKAFELEEPTAFRIDSVSRLAERYAAVAREAGKPVGMDVLNPALAYLAGHDYAAFAAAADWLKPRIYCHTNGPSSVPLEYRCVALGMRKWCHRASQEAIMRFLGRSIGIELPQNLLCLDHQYFPSWVATDLIRRSLADIPAPVHLGLEFSLHPDFETDLDAEKVRSCLAASAGAAGVVLCWNLLHIPDDFLRLAGSD